jgi:superfamily II DNA helicase RecQ
VSPQRYIHCFIWITLIPYLRFLSTPVGSRVAWHFWDEFHDAYVGHPERAKIWKLCFQIASELDAPMVFVSGTYPPHQHSMFCKLARLHKAIPVIRASTDRPEIGLHVLTTDSPDTWKPTVRLVQWLKSLLAPEERILVFFQKTSDADMFSEQTGSAVYHSQLPIWGNTKSCNLQLWDSGANPVMAASCAIAHGVDRKYVRFVVIYEAAFSYPSMVQQIGRAGRGGNFSYAIYIRLPNSHYTIPRPDVHCIEQLQTYATNTTICRRLLILQVMDGKDLALSCGEIPGCNPCDVCQPDGDMAQFFRRSLATSFVPKAPSLAIKGENKILASALPSPSAAIHLQPSPIAEHPTCIGARNAR